MNYVLHCRLLLPIRNATSAALPAMLRYARREKQFASAESLLCELFGVARQQDIPVAPYAALGDGLPADQGYWLRADPVSLVLQRDSFTLERAPETLSLAQAQQLVEALSAHFKADGMRFFAPAPHRWYLRLEQKPLLQTHPLPDVLHHDIQNFPLTGADAPHWQRQLNEMQMLLHTHPVNAALEEAGALPVNSLWLWGGGELSGAKEPAFTTWADDALPCGLAWANGNQFDILSLPSTAQEWLARAAAGAEADAYWIFPGETLQSDHLVVLPAWSPALERDWLEPLLSAVRDGRLAKLTLHLETPSATRRAPALTDTMKATIAVPAPQIHSYTLTRRSSVKFWRRSHPLEYYFD
ncbi:MAG: hypothetical protein LBE24_04840 [Methylobacillus sp.]|jgi:hypothetical protein|nr:hypothetical protein [Methylobacillus sp.]